MSDEGLPAAVRARRTFAIISHPDAGKTTLTENLLLQAGAIRQAGQVRARGQNRRTQSDWMKIERERGISVSSAVMTFAHEGVIFNLLDTPGHEDFSEDTYRTLTAADSAIMVLDAARGIEAQTLKLFEVCRLRDIPIITFINKIDREGLDGFALMDEISEALALDTTPMMWPIGMGNQLRGVVALATQTFTGFDKAGAHPAPVAFDQARGLIGDGQYETAREEILLASEGFPAFDLASYREGHLSPVYFGSALRSFGTKELLEAVASFAPPPQPQATKTVIVNPADKKVSGFVFKVQANMDANHRDRIAFVRLCSGTFKRGMKLRVSSTGKQIAVNNPILFFAHDRGLADEAHAGDILGIPNHGTLRVGDSLTESGEVVFTGIPNFAPEILRRVRLDDPMKAKHLNRALTSLAEEGVTQVFRPQIGSGFIVGVVGPLQLDVLVERIKNEYGIEAGFEASPFETARWVHCDDAAELERFMASHRGNMAEDRDRAPVFMGKSLWEVDYAKEKWPKIEFQTTRERA